MAIKSYSKGARAERELIHELSSQGFSVVRAAGSGVSGLSPDLLAFRKGEALALECKSISAETLYVQKDQIEEMQSWQENAGVDVYVAWKITREGWRFIKLHEMKETQTAFAITKERAMLIDRKLENLTRVV